MEIPQNTGEFKFKFNINTNIRNIKFHRHRGNMTSEEKIHKTDYQPKYLLRR